MQRLIVRGLLFLASGGFVAGCGSIPSERLIEARGIRIVGEDGRTRMELGVMETPVSNSASGIKLFDALGHERIALLVEDTGGAHINVRGTGGLVRVQISVTAMGTSEITLTDEDGANRLRALVDVNGEGRVVFRGANGFQEVELPQRGLKRQGD